MVTSTNSEVINQDNYGRMASNSIPFNLVHDDLRKIANEISVQVLTHQPENIYAFTADYLNKQLEKRERKDVENFIRNLVECDLTYEAMLKRRGVSLEQAHRASSVIQGSVRHFLGRRKVEREKGKFDMSMDLMTDHRSINTERMAETTNLQKECPPGDLKPVSTHRASSANVNHRLFCSNPGVSEGDVTRPKGPTVLAALQNLGAFDEQEESLNMDELLLPAPSQETNECATKNFAESMLMEIISRIFENDPLVSEKSFDQGMECLTVVDERKI